MSGAMPSASSSLLHVETARLRLRPLTPADALALLSLYRDPEVVRFMHTAGASESEERENIARHAERYYEKLGLGLLAGDLAPTSLLVGRYGLLRSKIDGVDETEVSYITAPEHRGKGYAAEAVRGLVDAAFARGIERLVAVILDDNVPSQRVAESVGFRLEKRVSYKEFGEVLLYAMEPHRTSSPE
jgi:[ribosomal protein S5]-alanine N-acetyltransferase